MAAQDVSLSLWREKSATVVLPPRGKLAGIDSFTYNRSCCFEKSGNGRGRGSEFGPRRRTHTEEISLVVSKLASKHAAHFGPDQTDEHPTHYLNCRPHVCSIHSCTSYFRIQTRPSKTLALQTFSVSTPLLFVPHRRPRARISLLSFPHILVASRF